MPNLSDFHSSVRFNLTQDSWLSAILGQPAFGVQIGKTGASISDVKNALANEDCFANIKLPCDDLMASLIVQEIGFKQIDTALTFASVIPMTGSCLRVRYAVQDDKDAVCAVARGAFSNSRFHLDPRIDNNKADEIKAQWAENFFHGKRGDAMLVVENEQGQVTGFCQVLDLLENGVVIDLIGISPRATGQKMGSQLLSFLWKNGISGNKPSKVLVGTQAANIGAVKFYENAGFRLIKAQNILHYLIQK